MSVRLRCLASLVLGFAIVATFPALSAAQGSPIYWKTKHLTWSGGTAKTRNFTNSVYDTAFVNLPSDIAWDVFGISGANTAMTVAFKTSTAAANADSVRYNVQYLVDGTANYSDSKDWTAAITNTATKVFNGSPGGLGLTFMGVISTDPLAPTKDKMAAWGTARLKVYGDAGGALAALQCWIYYPSRNPN